jgi:hypothetical protein
MDGAASIGVDGGFAHGDHAHPTVFQFTYVDASVSRTLTVAEVGTYLLYLYGAPTAGPVTLTFPVATTPVRVWQAMNITGAPLTLAGASGGTVSLQTGGNREFWTDTGGLYPLNTVTSTPQPRDNSDAVANTAWVRANLSGHSEGISFGGATVTDPIDLSRHISLYDGWGGFSVTSGALNVVSGGGLAMTFGGNSVSSFYPLMLSRDPVITNEAATKQYVDNAITARIGHSQWDGVGLAETRPGDETPPDPLEEMRATIAALAARVAVLEARP